MATLIIPTRPGGAYVFTQRTPLEGVEYAFRFEWNDRAGGWFMSLSSADDTSIIQSRRLVVDLELLKGVVGVGAPPGRMLLLEVSGGRNDPDFEGLGSTHLLHYIESV